ncbi:MAG: tRNA 2-thiouridine(34) synthase MnmA, partial [Pseudomonadales bacterium]|nr:tRNA 2-thiouridine(34) synthase MnmA [Pseudomonadales bacterium]
REIKFKVFLDYARILGADLIATGHYARLDHSQDPPRLLKGLDQGKDQSYFLQGVSGEQFRQCIFPLGELQKQEVRRIAEAHQLSTYAKKDSTGICFIGERRFRDFLEQYLPAQPGEIRDLEGHPVGTHGGLMYYTLGQRQGLGIGGVRHAPDAPWYVIHKDLTNNRLIVGQGNDNPALNCTRMHLKDIDWVGECPQVPARLAVKTRYRQPDQQCLLEAVGDGWQITFEHPQRAVTPGQWACFYQSDVCLGGGIIESTNQLESLPQ